MTPHYVYVVCYDDQKGPVKVGNAHDVTKRLKSLQTGCPFKISIFKEFVCNGMSVAVDSEKEFHVRMSDRRLIGEWFDMAPQDAAEALPAIIEEMKNKILSDSTSIGFHKDYSNKKVSKERECLDFIETYFRLNSYLPHVEDIAKGIKVGNHRAMTILSGLYSKGCIRAIKDGMGKIIGANIDFG